ncbi:unnamed protein product [Colias eurytheme]|nr:unnamed protein product [Colias eurytheme]
MQSCFDTSADRRGRAPAAAWRNGVDANSSVTKLHCNAAIQCAVIHKFIANSMVFSAKTVCDALETSSSFCVERRFSLQRSHKSGARAGACGETLLSRQVTPPLRLADRNRT